MKFYKGSVFIILFVLLTVLLVLVSCSGQTAKNTTIADNTKKADDTVNSIVVEDKNASTEANTKKDPEKTAKPSVSPDKAVPAQNNNSSPDKSIPALNKVTSFTEITRKEAGLDTIPRLDFSKLNLNSRLNELLQQNNYKDADYAAGIALPVSQDENTYIITGRFTGRIIEDIKIGTHMEQVKSILGVPTIKLNSSYYYKTNNYYIGFMGNPKVQMAAIIQNPKEYDKDTLLNLFNQLSVSSTFDKILENNKGFFDIVRFVNGGERLAISNNGIGYQDFSTHRVLTVYNNFEGKLFKDEFKKSGCFILYQNYDSVIAMIDSGMGSLLAVDDAFRNQGSLSPSGKYKAIYQWFYSMSQYFTIRSTDNSWPDFRIQAYTNEGKYKWLSDDYVLYIHSYEQEPYILAVGKTEQHINVLKELGVSDNTGIKTAADYEIVEVRTNTFTVRNKKDNTLLKVRFYLEAGKLKLEKDNNIQKDTKLNN